MLHNHELVLVDKVQEFFSNSLIKEIFHYEPFISKLLNDLSKHKKFNNLLSLNIKDISSLVQFLKEGKNY
ncbi:hypothetical protein IKS57_03535 [bacterium]|nr:hypothetical protein [bacterium]